MPIAPAVCMWKTKDPRSSDYDTVEVLCPGCGKHHVHGAEEGLRLAHCKEHERRFPSYYVKIPKGLPVKYRK